MADSLNDLGKAFEGFLNDFSKERRELVENAGEKLHKRVLRKIGSDTKEKTGNLKKGCELHIGSGGGYAAVRNNHLRAPHAYLVEFGHNIKEHGSGKDKRKSASKGKRTKYTGKKKKKKEKPNWVPGKFMYTNAMNELEGELTQDAEDMIDKLVGEYF